MVSGGGGGGGEVFADAVAIKGISKWVTTWIAVVTHFYVTLRFYRLTFENRGAISFIACVVAGEIRRVFLNDIEM